MDMVRLVPKGSQFLSYFGLFNSNVYTTKIFCIHQKTPLEIADEHSHKDVVDYLNKQGVSL